MEYTLTSAAIKLKKKQEEKEFYWLKPLRNFGTGEKSWHDLKALIYVNDVSFVLFINQP